MRYLTQSSYFGIKVATQQKMGSHLGCTSKLVEKRGKRVSDVSKRKSLALRVDVNCAQHDIFSKAKQGLVTPHPNTLQARGDCKQAQIIYASIGSNNSHPIPTPAHMFLCNVGSMYELVRAVQMCHESI
jgi:hypothetical protein